MEDLIIYVVLFAVGYLAGHVHMLVKLAHMIVEQDEDLKQVGTNEVIQLDLEKHNDVYYAYLGNKFVGQSDQLEILFNNLVTNSKISKMVIGESVNKLSAQDQAEFSKILSKYPNV
jgi:hypothetical protein